MISVIIPTYKRPKDLAKCLDALKNQNRKTDEVLVIVHNKDKETKVFLKKSKYKKINLKTIIINKASQVAALNAGLEKAKGNILCFTDDDCIPKKDWLELIEKHFSSNIKIGAVGGKDNLYHNNQLIKGKRKKIGIITWYGKVLGYHHLGYGNPRYVDSLKGSNMAFRREAINGTRFDKRLKGKGAEYFNDTAMCLAIKKKGWKIIYDPNIEVDHHPSIRYEDNKRGNYDWNAVYAGAYNKTLILSEYLKGIKKLNFLIYEFLIGNIFTPGILSTIRLIPREKHKAFLRFFAAMKGKLGH